MCRSALGQWASGVCLFGNRKKKRAKRQSVINYYICAAGKLNRPSAAISPSDHPTGSQVHNRAAKLLKSLNCFCSFHVIQAVWCCSSVTCDRVTGRYKQFKILSVLCSCSYTHPFSFQDCLWRTRFYSCASQDLYIFPPHFRKRYF